MMGPLRLFPPLTGVRRTRALRPEVERDRLELLFRRTPMGYAMTGVNALILILASWTSFSPVALGVWGVAMAGALIWRMVLEDQWQGRPSVDTDFDRWEKRFAMCIGFSGLLWGGMGSAVFVVATPALQVGIAFIFAGLAAGAVVSYGYSRFSLYCFLLPILVPLILALLVDSRPTSFLMALLVAVYGLAMVELGENTYRHVLGTLNLRSEKEDLVSELQRRNEELTSTNETLIDVDLALQKEADARGDFLAVMTHEIRTPLNAVIGMSDLLHDETDPQRRREMIDAIGSSGKLLLHLVNNILDISKIDSGELNLEWKPFSLQKAIGEVVSIIALHARKKNVRLEWEVTPAVPEWIKGDVTRIQQILMNLVNNALKFTEQGAVTVHADVLPKGGEDIVVQLSVRDTGIGITGEQQKRLFQKYSQGDASTTRSFGGTGLGLAICKGLADAMGGDIHVHSVAGKGSEFVVTIPTRATRAARVNEGNGDAESLRESVHSLKVLVVDDNPLNLEVALRYLAKLGVGAEGCDGGVAAVERCRSTAYDLVLMDMMMPDLDGMGAMKRIRSEGQGKPRIVILTASAMVEEKRRCLEAGADGYVSKPLQLRDLEELFSGYRESSEQRVDPGVLNHLRMLTGKGEEDFLGRIIGRFEVILEQELPLLRREVESGDAEGIRRKAHFLKGASQNLGAVRLVALLGKLEKLGREGNVEACRSLMGEVFKEGEQVCRILKDDWLNKAA